MALLSDLTFNELRSTDVHNNLGTRTTTDQALVESACIECLMDQKHGCVTIRSEGPHLDRDLHAEYCQAGLRRLGRGYQGLDASQPWCVYWIIHSMELIDRPVAGALLDGCIERLRACKNASGGFGGGPGQLSHLAPTYAAVNALVTIGTTEALEVIDREPLVAWIRSMKSKSGSFHMSDDGEADVRAAYCAVSVVRLLQLLPHVGDLFQGTPQWVATCQNYDGGMAAEPGNEAHGGYAFCALACVAMLDASNSLDISSLLRWAAFRQMRLEGGFQGRAHKLVDGCYSFWVGGVFPLLHHLLEQGKVGSVPKDAWMYSQEGLQDYIIHCCQHTFSGELAGGLRDKPGKGRDYYHTCYCLSGLASSQHTTVWDSVVKAGAAGSMSVDAAGDAGAAGDDSDILLPTDPYHNVSARKVAAATEYFASRPFGATADAVPQ